MVAIICANCEMRNEIVPAEILKILLRDEELGEDVDLAALGVKTESFSGSDLKRAYSIGLNTKDDCSRFSQPNPLDLCIAAALDAVKESVDVPWIVPTKAVTHQETDSNTISISSTSSRESPIDEPLANNAPITTTIPDFETVAPVRVLRGKHFAKALQEITPSSSESLGTLASLRKWNDEFGEGATAKGRKRRGWGEKFGFGPKPSETGRGSNVNVTQPPPSTVTPPIERELPDSPASSA